MSTDRASAGPSNPSNPLERVGDDALLALFCLLARRGAALRRRLSGSAAQASHMTAIFSRGAIDASVRGSAPIRRLSCRRVGGTRAAGCLVRLFAPAARLPRSCAGPAAPLRYSAPRPPPFSEVRDRQAGPGLLFQEPRWWPEGQRRREKQKKTAGICGCPVFCGAAAGGRRPGA